VLFIRCFFSVSKLITLSKWEAFLMIAVPQKFCRHDK
jgi:hypothetical protein